MPTSLAVWPEENTFGLRGGNEEDLWKTKVRTRSTTTRDRNLQFRGSFSTGFFGIFFSGFSCFSPGFLCNLVRNPSQSVEKIPRFPGGEKCAESCHVFGCHGFLNFFRSRQREYFCHILGCTFVGPVFFRHKKKCHFHQKCGHQTGLMPCTSIGKFRRSGLGTCRQGRSEMPDFSVNCRCLPWSCHRGDGKHRKQRKIKKNKKAIAPPRC